jgi:hypothetical protein
MSALPSKADISKPDDQHPPGKRAKFRTAASISRASRRLSIGVTTQLIGVRLIVEIDIRERCPLLSSRLLHRSATNGSRRIHVAEAIVLYEG